MKLLLLLCSLVLLVNARPGVTPTKGPTCGYAGCPDTPTDKLNIHLVPHSHDDVGWLKTVDQYYYGSQTGIQRAGVQYILDSVVTELQKNPERKFMYVESEFFFKWYNEQTPELQKITKTLVNEGRLEFVGGAWSMNDEAATHYQSVIDQFSLGLRHLDLTFGKCARPRVGWQIDPFGHSREMASMFGQMGYDGQFFARLDYVDKNKRMSNQTAEMIWHGSSNLGPTSDLFTGALRNHYSAPSGFCYDVLCADPPIIDGYSYDNNVNDRVDAFISYVSNLNNSYRTNNLMVPMGDDFQYQNAIMNYKNMDKLIKYVNARQANGSNINVFYSTPSCYLKSLHDSKITWPEKSDDFFPYSSSQNSSWTGYFTSRPTQKRFEREGNHFLQTCKQLSVFAHLSGDVSVKHLEKFKEIMGIMQHHDAITGTEKQAVAFNYNELVTDAIEECAENAEAALRTLTNLKGGEFDLCLNLNISSCPAIENLNQFVVTIFNPLGHKTEQYVRIPIQNGQYNVTDENGKLIKSQVVPLPESIKNLTNRESKTVNELVFKVNVDKITSYTITKTTSVNRVRGLRSTRSERFKDIISIAEKKLEKFCQSFLDRENVVNNTNVKLTFSADRRLSSVTMNNITENIRQDFLYYEGATNGARSGAYIFRPNGTVKQFNEIIVATEIVTGDLVTEVHQKFNNWISQVIRIYEGKNLVEFEWMVGPIPIEDNIGKEIITRYSSEISSNGEFYTDSNGREMLKRVRNQRPDYDPDLTEKISSNYYPITAKIAIEDKLSRLAILNDRAEGGSSLDDGDIELMLHRRLLVDDGYGVGEALNETVNGEGLIARGKHYLILTPTERNMQIDERKQQLESLLPVWLFFSANKTINNTHDIPEIANFSAALPDTVHLLTLEPWSDNEILIRFENFLEKTEGDAVTFNIKSLFDQMGGSKIVEKTLDGNLDLSALKRLQFTPDGGKTLENDVTGADHVPLVAMSTDKADKYEILLNPMQIRTFVIKLKK